MLDSRLDSTRVLGEAITRCAHPPPVWLNSSTATIYKHTFGPAWGEAGEIGGCSEAKDVFSVFVATEWERVFGEANTPRTRKVALRSAMVLGHARNSVLPNLLRLGRLGLGGSLAGGRQFVSWIHQEDFCRAVEWIIEHESLLGPVNLAALGANVFFIVLHFVQTHLWYDGLAQDVSILSSQGSVIVLLVFVLMRGSTLES